MANKNLRVVGLKQVLKCLDTGRIRCVILAENADEWLQECVAESAKDKATIVKVDSMDILAKYCKVDVPTAVAGLLD